VRPLRLTLLAATTAGLAVAVAPAIPEAIRAPVLVAALAAWTAAAGASLLSAARRLARRRPTPLVAAGLAGAVLAAAAMTQLEITRQAAQRPALTWNVDWRYALNHAQAIARTGGVDSALDYAGAAVEYHVGPAWFAGATHRLFGAGMTTVLFGLVPLLCTITFAIGAWSLLRALNVGAPLALSATGLAMALPGVAFTLPMAGYCLVLASCRTSPVLWTFSHEMMLNSFLAIAVGVAVLALVLQDDAGWGVLVAAAAGLAATLMIKPRTFIAFALLIGTLGLGQALGLRWFRPRSPRLLLVAVGAGMLAMLFFTTLPHVSGRFATPEFAPGRTEFPFTEDRLVPTALMVIALLGARGFLREHARVRTLLVTTFAVLFALAALWALVRVPVHDDLLRRMTELGVDVTQRADFAQSLQPLRLLVTLLALAALIGSVPLLDRRRLRAAHALGWAVALSPLLFIGSAVAHPSRAYEAVDDPGLLDVLRRVPADAGLMITSDLADAAQDYRRPLRGFALTAYAGHPFYVANIQYGHHAHDDAAQRMADLRAFFGSRWSPRHAQWLKEAGIGAILVNDRCPPVWLNQPDLPLREIARAGRWSAFVSGRHDDAGPSGWPPWQDVPPRYGRAACLTGAAPPADEPRTTHTRDVTTSDERSPDHETP